MYKVMLVDDVKDMVEGLANLIDWNAYDCCIVGKAFNGKEALDVALKEHPDLIITDIGMPLMNGLEFMKSYKKSTEKRVEFIILSCHDEFDYAKEALQMGALDYLIKDTLLEEDIVDVLRTAINKISENHQRKERLTVLDKQFRASQVYLETRLLKDYLKQIISIDELHSKSMALGISLPHRGHRVFHLYINDFESNIGDQELTDFSIINVVEESLSNVANTKCFLWDKGHFICFFWNDTDTIFLTPRIRNCIEKMIIQLKDLFNIEAHVYVTEVFKTLEEFSFDQKTHTRYSDSVFYSAMQSITTKTRPLSRASYNEVSLAFQAIISKLMDITPNNITYWNDSLKTLFELFEENKTSPDVVRHCLEDILQSIRVKIGENYSMDTSIMKLQIQNAWNIESYKRSFTEILKVIKTHIEHCNKDVLMNDIVKDVVEIIEKDISQPITLQTLSIQLSINRSYLSRIFKEDTKMSFSEYLKKKRIAKATKLLTETDMLIEDIIKSIGLEDISYFYKMYKKETGRTPKEAREGKNGKIY